MHQAQATPPAIIRQESEAQRVARVRATFAILDAEKHKKQKQAKRELDELAAAGKLGRPDTFYTVRQQACDECGAVNNAPYIDYPPAANVKMQARQPSKERSIWPGARTKEADRKSNLSAWRKPSDKERKRLERLPVYQVAALDEL